MRKSRPGNVTLVNVAVGCSTSSSTFYKEGRAEQCVANDDDNIVARTLFSRKKSRRLAVLKYQARSDQMPAEAVAKISHLLLLL